MNVVTLTGRLVAEPARTETSRGVKTTFRLAVDGRPRLWIDIDTWGQLAGGCATHLHRSRAIAVSGRLECDEWTDRDGHRRTRWHVNATTVTYLDRPGPVADPHGCRDGQGSAHAGSVADPHTATGSSQPAGRP